MNDNEPCGPLSAHGANMTRDEGQQAKQTHTLDDVKNDMQASLNDLGQEPTVEQLQNQVIYMVKAFEVVYSIAEGERRTLIRALSDAQESSKMVYARLHETKYARFKLFVKKLLIGLGWYEASTQELELIHNQNHGLFK